MNANELRKQITQTIVESLASGTIPFWKRPWTNDPNCGAPVNIVSHHAYKGINPLLLTIASIKNGFVSRYWASYKQWRSMGGQVRKGSKGTIIVFYRTIEKESEQGDEKSKRFFVLRYYTLFNLDQVDGATVDNYRPGQSNGTEPAPADWTKVADEVIAATGADIRYGGNRAFFSPSEGYIQVPARQQFTEAKNFYGVLFHELSHWSCPTLEIKGEYAFEELVAELTSAFISWQLGIPQSDDLTNVKAYLASWLQGMQNDPKWIFQASAAASRSADFILAFSQKAQAEPPPEAEAA